LNEQEKINFDALLYQLYQQTACEVKRIRVRARSGLRDEARDWLRFFQNSQLLSILSLYSGVFPIDVPVLQKEFSELNSEVHPLQPSENKTDIETIRERLDELVKMVQERDKVPAGRNQRGRGDSELCQHY
jgi:hypothetical protein